MIVNYVETRRCEADIKFVDINVVSEDEMLLCERFWKCKDRYYVSTSTDNISKRRTTRFYILFVLTLSGCNIPIGTQFNIPLTEDGWSFAFVFAKDKACGITSFEPDEYTEDEAKLKNMLHDWAEKNGIVFYSNSVKRKLSEQALELYSQVVRKYCDEIFSYLKTHYGACFSDFQGLQGFLIYIRQWRFYVNDKEFLFHGCGCSVYVGKEEICCWDFGLNENLEHDLHSLQHDEYKIKTTLNHIDIKRLEIKVLVMPFPKKGVQGVFPDFHGFSISRKLDVYAFGTDFVMTYDIAYDPTSLAENSFVHGELHNLILSRRGFTLEDNCTEYKYHFVPKEEKEGFVITTVKERYNSQSPTYKEILKDLGIYVEDYYEKVTKVSE